MQAAAELRAPQLPLPGPDNSHLEALWSIVVEGELFASSHERKALGLQLFSVLLPHLRWVSKLTSLGCCLYLRCCIERSLSSVTADEKCSTTKRPKCALVSVAQDICQVCLEVGRTSQMHGRVFYMSEGCWDEYLGGCSAELYGGPDSKWFRTQLLSAINLVSPKCKATLRG